MENQINKVDTVSLEVINSNGYEFKQFIGGGEFGRTYRVADRSGKPFTVKVRPLSKCYDHFTKREKLPQDMLDLPKISHINVIRYFEMVRSGNNFYIFMEFAGNGDIASYLKKNGVMSEAAAGVWFADTANAVLYLHERMGFAHRDIKIDNILLNEHNIVKLCDLERHGIFMRQRIEIYCRRFDKCQPNFSPEMVCRETHHPFGADVWALGVMLFAVLNNKFPFQNVDPEIMKTEMRNHPNHVREAYVKDFSSQCRELIEQMLDPSVRSRICIRRVVEHQWVKRKGRCG